MPAMPTTKACQNTQFTNKTQIALLPDTQNCQGTWDLTQGSMGLQQMTDGQLPFLTPTLLFVGAWDQQRTSIGKSFQNQQSRHFPKS